MTKYLLPTILDGLTLAMVAAPTPAAADRTASAWRGRRRTCCTGSSRPPTNHENSCDGSHRRLFDLGWRLGSSGKGSTLRIAIGAALALALGVFCASSAEAAAADEAGSASKLAQGAQPAHGLRADIDALLQKLETATGGVVTWDGAGRFDVRRDGNAEVADIADARVTIDLKQVKRAESPWTASRFAAHRARTI